MSLKIEFFKSANLLKATEEQEQQLKEKRRILICAVQPGPVLAFHRSRQIYMSEEAIKDLVPLIKENTMMLDNHKDREDGTREFTQDMVSWIVPETVRLAEEGEFENIAKGSLIAEAEFATNPATTWLYDDLQKNPNLLELSIVTSVVYEVKKIGKVEYSVATKALAHWSLDWVDYGAAGGLVLAASKVDKMSEADFRAHLDLDAKWKAQVDDPSQVELLQLKEIQDNINLDVILKTGSYILNFVVDMLFFSDMSYDEIEKATNKAIDDMFALIKSMDILAIFGVDTEQEELKLDQLPELLAKYLWTGGDTLPASLSIPIVNSDKLKTYTLIKEDAPLDKKEILAEMAKLEGAEKTALLQEIPEFAKLSQDHNLLSETNEALVVENTEFKQKEETSNLEKEVAEKREKVLTFLNEKGVKDAKDVLVNALLKETEETVWEELLVSLIAAQRESPLLLGDIGNISPDAKLTSTELAAKMSE